MPYAAAHVSSATIFVPELPLHASRRGNDRQPIFGGDVDVRFYRACLARAARDHGVAIHAYVVDTRG